MRDAPLPAFERSENYIALLRFGTSTLIMPLQYVSDGIDLLVLILSHWTHNSTILEVDAILVYKISYDL